MSHVGGPTGLTRGPRPADPRAAMLLVIVAGVLWGTIGLGARAAFRWGLSPAESALWRAGGAFLLLLPAAAVSGFTAFRIRARDLPLFAGFGLIGVAVFMTVYFEAIRRSTLATAAILLYTGPAWVVLLARLFYREPLTTKARRWRSHSRLRAAHWSCESTILRHCG